MTLLADGSDGEKVLRGQGRGSSFFVLGRAIWQRLWTTETVNRINFVAAFLVLLAGTGSDHRLTKWSAKACEDHVGIGKPRARLAIDELVSAGLVKRTATSTKLTPQYELEQPEADGEPIFLPVQLITGFRGEASILRRVRETGDALVLRMLVDLYGAVQTDATYGIPLSMLRQAGGAESTKLFEMGAHAVWALDCGNTLYANGEWMTAHHTPSVKGSGAWQEFWHRVDLLRRIGALQLEPWVMDGSEPDAEPLFPVSLAAVYEDVTHEDEIGQLTQFARAAAEALSEERPYLIEAHTSDILVPLPVHRRAPALRGVARMRIEPDTPGRRRSYGNRVRAIETWMQNYQQLASDAAEARYDRPLRSVKA